MFTFHCVLCKSAGRRGGKIVGKGKGVDEERPLNTEIVELEFTSKSKIMNGPRIKGDV
jgi:hypothetical protein